MPTYTLKSGESFPEPPWEIGESACASEGFTLVVEPGVTQARVRDFLDALAMLLSPIDEGTGEVDLSNPYMAPGGES